jgi:hypothetical protein
VNYVIPPDIPEGMTITEGIDADALQQRFSLPGQEVQ